MHAGNASGFGSRGYNSVEGYDTGVSAVISNMANIASHGGKNGISFLDLFSVILKCHDPNGELYILA